MTKTDQTRKAVTRAEAAAMLRAAFNLFSRWRITDAQAQMLLGQPSVSTYKRWREGRTESIPKKTIVRVVDLLGIHNALCIMFREPEQGDYWISRPNKAFGGRLALDRMLDGTPSDIRAVRSYLDLEGLQPARRRPSGSAAARASDEGATRIA